MYCSSLKSGLYPAKTTIIGEDLESKEYIEVELNGGKVIKIDKDAQLMIKRDGKEEPFMVYADELQADDDILFDNKDLIFTINEI